MRFVAAFALSSVLALVAGCGSPSFLVTPITNTNELTETEVLPGKGMFQDKIAIVEVEGMLKNAKSGELLGPTENVVSLFSQELNTAAADSRVKAIVLRVNSPGGTVSASDAMYQILKRFKEKTRIPVVASAQEVDASGAYYVSCAADKIVAQPTTIVGSIGVIFEMYNLEGTMMKLGVTSSVYKSAEHKDIGSLFRQATPEEKQIMQGMVDEYYLRFKGIVAGNRHLPDDATFKTLTDGRVFSGEQAMKLGLIDQTGLLEDAIDLAKLMGNAPNAKVVSYKRPYGYGGSIYATNSVTQPRADVIQLQLPEAASFVPSGFYYLWQP